MNKIDSYLNIIHESQLLSEEIGIDLPTVNKSMVKRVKSSIDEKNPKKTFAALKKLTPPGFKGAKGMLKVDAYLTSKSDDFKAFKVTATQVVKNSLPEVSPKMVAVAGLYLATVSTMFVPKTEQNKPAKQILKNNIKDFISKCRKFGEDYDEDESDKPKKRTSDVADLAVAMVIITAAAAMAAGLLSGVIIIAKAVALFITGWFPPIAIGGMILLAFIFGMAWLGKMAG